MTASGVHEAQGQEYGRFARAKGMKPGRIVRRHLLRNILIPVVTVIGMELGTLIAYSTITETVFSWPGMGKLLIASVYQLGRPVIVAYVMLLPFLFFFFTLLADSLIPFFHARSGFLWP